jgi:uncharacterized membrane protein
MGDPWKASLVAELHDDAASRSAGPVGCGACREASCKVTDNMSQYPSTRRAGYASDSGGWWAGAGLFAALIMILVGIWQAMVGLIALVQNDFYVATRDYPFKFDATTWGWIHLLGGVLLALAGWALLSGRTWARVVGIVLAVLSAIANFLDRPVA